MKKIVNISAIGGELVDTIKSSCGTCKAGVQKYSC